MAYKLENEISELTQAKYCSAYSTLKNYTDTDLSKYQMNKSDESSNINDITGKSYKISKMHMSEFMDILEKCRRMNAVAHYAEKQASSEYSHSGIMLDFDLYIDNINPILSPDDYITISRILLRTLTSELDMSTSQIQNYIIFFTLKPQPVISDNNSCYRYGFHIVIPCIQVSKEYKNHLIAVLRTNTRINSILSKLGVSQETLKTSLDSRSYCVPVLMFGSSKRGFVPYKLGACVSINIDPEDTNDMYPRIVTPDVLNGYNLVAEMSIIHSATYQDKQPLVLKQIFEPKPEVSEKLSSIDSKIIEEDLLTKYTEMQNLLADDAAKLMYDILMLIAPQYYNNSEIWTNCIVATLRANDSYKPIAIAWSKKTTIKGTESFIDNLWKEKNISLTQNPSSVRTIHYYARESNRVGYEHVNNKAYFKMLSKEIYAFDGTLEHYHVACVMKHMLITKYLTKRVPKGGASSLTEWYEFITPETPATRYTLGTMWKWQKEDSLGAPIDLQRFISEEMSKIVRQIHSHVSDEKGKSEPKSDKLKYYSSLSTSIKRTLVKFGNDTFKNCILKQASYLFDNKPYLDLLDSNQRIMGVGNGILLLNRNCKLVDTFHEYPVSKFTKYKFKKFDPNNEWIKLALKAIEDVISEPDAREFILMHAAQCLQSGPKDGLFLLLVGSGRNGKSTFIYAIKNALGQYAGKFHIGLFTDKKEKSTSANPAKMDIAGKNYAYSEEANPDQELETSQFKELINSNGEITGRYLFENNITFKITCNFVIATNYEFIIKEKDDGTWRRFLRYVFKSKYVSRPDPKHVCEKQVNEDFVKNIVEKDEYVEAILSILVHYYERLTTEYNGELKNVYSPTIVKETEEFRLSQDTLHRWISSRVVLQSENTTEPKSEYFCNVVAQKYQDWYREYIDSRNVPTKIENTIKEIENSELKEYITTINEQQKILTKCRILEKNEEPKFGEKFLVQYNQEAKAKNATYTRFDWWNGPDKDDCHSTTSIDDL